MDRTVLCRTLLGHRVFSDKVNTLNPLNTELVHSDAVPDLGCIHLTLR